MPHKAHLVTEGSAAQRLRQVRSTRTISGCYDLVRTEWAQTESQSGLYARDPLLLQQELGQGTDAPIL